MWNLMTPAQQQAFMASKSVRERLEIGLSESEFQLFYPDADAPAVAG
ncbi:hypothetical protein [Paraburkholderia sp. SIMBA_054]